MAKIQNVGLGKFIRGPKGRRTSGNVRVGKAYQIVNNDGNSFRCFEVLSSDSGRIVLDETKWINIRLDQEVQEVTI